jgi:hypothetical protein
MCALALTLALPGLINENLHDGKDAKLFSADDSILTLCPSPAVINSGAMLQKQNKNTTLQGVYYQEKNVFF